MWQLRQRWQNQQGDEARQTEKVQLESFRVRQILTVLVDIGLGIDGGLLGARFVHPLNYAAIGLSVLGGVALGVLVVAIPGQAWRVLKRGAIAVGLIYKRRRMRRLAVAERTSRKATGTTQSEALSGDLAVAEYLRGAPGAAEAALAEGLELDGDNGCLRNNLAVVRAERGQHERAAEGFVRTAPDCRQEMALNCALVAPLLASPRILEQLIAESDQPNATAFNNIGVSYARQGDWETAAEWFVKASEADPNLAAARANLGLVAYRNGQLQEAADSIQMANRLAPNEPTFAGYMGVILAAAGQIDQARFYLKRAHRVDPASVGIRVNVSAAEAVGGHWKLAAKGFQGLLNAGEHLARVEYNLAVAQLAVGDVSAAAANAAAAVAAGDTSADAYSVLGVALWDAGRHAEALSHFTTAASAPDAGPLAASNLGRALLMQGQIDRALVVLEQAQARWRDDPTLGSDYATAMLAWGAIQYRDDLSLEDRTALLTKLQRCVPELEKAVRRQDEASLEAHVNMGLYLYIQEQYPQAAEYFEAAFRLDPQLRELQYLVGTALGREGERLTLRTEDGDFAPTAAGRQFLRRAVPHLEAGVGARDIVVAASYNLARCLYVLKDYERALTIVRRAVRADAGQELNSLAALAAARAAQRMQLIYKTQLLSGKKRDQMRSRALELLNVAVHFFRQALLRDEMDPTSHGNLGIAYMLRNREHDVEAALRHWERMRAIGGGSMARRYDELAQMENLADPGRVGFDDRNAKLAGLEVLRWLTVPPPRPSDVRFIVEPVAVQLPWRLVARSPRLRAALQLRDEIAADELRLARLRV